jgi:hypothetical protein
VNNAERIMKFVNTIIDSVADIVRGNVSAVVNKIEDVLGQMVPILIGFLASVIGVGGIGQKIREIIQKLQRPINQALDFVIKTGLKLAGPVIRGIKGFAGKVKSKVAAGKAWVKRKAEAGQKWVKGKVESGKRLASETGAKAREFVGKMKQKLLAVVFKRNFTAAGEKHSVFSEKGRPEQLWVASERRLVSSLRQPHIKELMVSYGNLVKSYQTRIASLPATAPKTLVDQLAKDMPLQALIIIDKIVRLVGKEFDQERAPAQLGNVALHSSQPGHPRPGKGRLRKTWSEHVIPRYLVTKFFTMLGKKGVTDPEYNRMTTVLTYKTASRIKDHGEGDLQMLAVLRNNLPAGSRGIKNTPAQVADIKHSWDILSANAIGREVAAVAGDYHMFKDVRKVADEEESPAPDQGRIQSAATAQKAEILAFASKRGIT